MKKLFIPNITNPGLSFTENTYDMLKRIHQCFAGKTIASIPYKDFQDEFVKQDATGDSKIRMVFPIMRKAGCIYPPSASGDVVFHEGDFLTDLGKSFLGASQLYYEMLAKLSEPDWKHSAEIKDIFEKVRVIYSGIAKQMFENLSENDDAYRHLLWFVNKYKSVTKYDVQILLAVLELGSSKRGSVERCARDDMKLDGYITAHRAKKLQLEYEGSNNAAGYYLAILKSLLILDSHNGAFSLTSLGKECFIEE